LAQIDNKQETPVVFTDRDYCVSGDTVWFKVWVPESSEIIGNIVRVQVDNVTHNLISAVAVKSVNNWANGFIYIPDSLSSGQYFVTAFLNSQRNNPDLEVKSKSLLVYNRFETKVNKIVITPPTQNKETTNDNTFVSISTGKKQYRQRENVKLKIDFDFGREITKLIVKATLIDPLASEIQDNYQFKVQSSNACIPDFAENDGFLLSGKVTDGKGNSVSDALVILSIGGEQPYFDYYYLGENDDFHFFIKNAIGNSNIVLQVVSNSLSEYFIQLENNSLERKEPAREQVEVLTYEQIEFINTAINGNFAYKLFNFVVPVQSDNLEISTKFSVPFYGKPTLRVIPEEFIDLPDFQEISREILPGVQCRSKNGEVTFRLLNIPYNIFFEDEPLRLINGIPVFKNNILANLKSTDINYIDIVKNERIFGDIIFKGILAVSLFDKSNSWLAQQANLSQFYVGFLQPDKKPNYFYPEVLAENQPDMRQVYLWEMLEADFAENLEFNLSDRKGKIEISVEGITVRKEYFRSSKIIEVK
jgi:hypothetical protein